MNRRVRGALVSSQKSVIQFRYQFMPLQNRVDPWGTLHVNPSRSATVMGNRGILHNATQHIVKRWANKSWVACDPHYRGISRKPLFKNGSYSELFFLDEVTALAAGHRPCAYCQRVKYNFFKANWADVFCNESSTNPSVIEIDRQLHTERVARGAGKLKYVAKLTALPEGVIFEHQAHALLIYRGKCWRWSFDGYVATSLDAYDGDVEVLTPRSVVRLLSAGYTPDVHASAHS